MTTETKKMIERIPLEVFNNDNFGLIDELVSTDFVEHADPPGVAPTREGFKKWAIELRRPSRIFATRSRTRSRVVTGSFIA